ncbi:MAG: CBS domain-containing protein [Candidatus Aceula meridiana]|nr:CBS domain-containing protein [Candidatus Aceula meridiana]
MSVLHKIYIKDIMTKNLITIGFNDPFSRVWDKIRTHKIRHIPVVNKSGELRGLISQRDLYRTVSPKKRIEDEGLFYSKERLDEYLIEQVMTAEVCTLTPSHTVGCAMDIIVKKKYGCIPIVDEKGILVGIITPIDILRAIANDYL